MDDVIVLNKQNNSANTKNNPLKAFCAGIARKGYIAKIASVETTLCVEVARTSSYYQYKIYGKDVVLRLLVRFTTAGINSSETMLCWSLQERVNIANTIPMETLLYLGFDKRWNPSGVCDCQTMERKV